MTIVSSAPGKVLIAGAYTVLDEDDDCIDIIDHCQIGIGCDDNRNTSRDNSNNFDKFSHSSFVFALDRAKFHAIGTIGISSIAQKQRELLSNQNSPHSVYFTFHFPQFGAEDSVIIKINSDNHQIEEEDIVKKSHPFVWAAVKVTLDTLVISWKELKDLEISLIGDAPFYSTDSYSVGECHGHKFSYFGPDATIPGVGKTGLGSSAALTTCLMSTLHKLLLSGSNPSLSRLFWTSQMAHSLAQDKIGSGFDIACAVYAQSIFYTRFPSRILSQLNQQPEHLDTFDPETYGLVRRIDDNNDNDDDDGRKKQPFIQISLITSHLLKGSHTPSMVKAVLEWRERNPNVWQSLKKRNQEFCQLLYRCSHQRKEIESQRSELSFAYREIRRLLKQMGNEAGVPIEPDCQGQLIDRLVALNGDKVLFGGVPGAGGYDAIFLCSIVGSEIRVVGEDLVQLL